LARNASIAGTPRSVHRWINAALIAFAGVMIVALSIQAFSSQALVAHEVWRDLLESISAQHAAQVRRGDSGALPGTGVIRSWYAAAGTTAPAVPDYLAGLAPGYYSSETMQTEFDTGDSFHALVVDLPSGRLVTSIDIAELEAQQNRDSRLSLLWVVLLAAFVLGMNAWLHANLVRPVRDLAERMRSMVPGHAGARLPTDYPREEIQDIARASNAHLERVEQFIERERSLLDQASHEFRTPIAVISGALDVLKQIDVPAASMPALQRIEYAVEDLSETMVALLYLAREPEPQDGVADVALLHEILPRLVRDHEHILRGKSAQLSVGVAEIAPTFIAAPEAMLRIAISNLLRNAIENTEVGYIEIALEGGVVCVTDSGSGFDPVEAARRYRDSLRSPGRVRGQGLGLFLIGRICDRFGWKLSIEPLALGGTRARLDLSASVLAPSSESAWR
jgi:signal transduction histidine kinase